MMGRSRAAAPLPMIALQPGETLLWQKKRSEIETLTQRVLMTSAAMLAVAFVASFFLLSLVDSGNFFTIEKFRIFTFFSSVLIVIAAPNTFRAMRDVVITTKRIITKDTSLIIPIPREVEISDLGPPSLQTAFLIGGAKTVTMRNLRTKLACQEARTGFRLLIAKTGDLFIGRVQILTLYPDIVAHEISRAQRDLKAGA
ncbi:MAG: hypothetical protein AAF503_14895 [Pseudomonadota bacterium]